MMENRIDEFIKQKAGDTHITPSPDAWDRLESQLPKKDRKAIYMRIAAAVALVISAGFTFWLVQQNMSGNSSVSQRNVDIPSIERKGLTQGFEEVQQLPEEISIADPADKKEAVQAYTASNGEVKSSVDHNQEEEALPLMAENQEVDETERQQVNEIDVALPEIKTEDQLALNEAAKNVEPKQQKESITIVYKPSRKVAAAPEEHQSEIDKAKKNVKDFIEDAKDKGDNTIEDLRAISNNVVALNVGRLKEKVFKNNKNEAKP
jgi:hypothetical protein